MLSTTAAGKPLYLVETPSDLAQCLQVLRREKRLALDLEFDSHSYAYGVTLCLVQLATPTACYLIDALAEIDLNGLFDLLEDPEIQKIVHSPGEDLRLLHSLQCFPKNVFDTEVVAKLLNYEKTSLAVLLSEKLGVTMDKKQQRSNWLRRPLSQEQLEYAGADVDFLHRLQDILINEAAGHGLMDFVNEEQDALSTTIHQTEQKTSFLKHGDLYALSPYDQYLLNELFVFRDELAREKNKPAYQMIDEALIRSLAAGDLQPQDILHTKGIYGSLKQERFVRQLRERIGKIHEAASELNLSRSRPPRIRQTNDFRLSREKAELDKSEKFEPVQRALAERFGEHAARFILSNGTVNELLKKNLTIAEIKRDYKRKVILSAAAGLNIDLSEY